MIDILTVLLMHGLLVVMFWRLLWRDDLDKEPQPKKPSVRGTAGDAQPEDGEDA